MQRISKAQQYKTAWLILWVWERLEKNTHENINYDFSSADAQKHFRNIINRPQRKKKNKTENKTENKNVPYDR